MIDKRIIDAINIAVDYPVINKVGIFGSYARGEQTKDSDIDILYDYDYDDNDTSFIISVLDYLDAYESRIREKIGDVKNDYVSLNGLMESDNRKFKKTVLDDVIWIYDKKSHT